MNDRSPLVVVTTAGAAFTVVALVVLLVGALSGNDVVSQVGLGLLFGVPVVRNLAVLVTGQGRDRALAVLGIVLVILVGGLALARRDAQALDPPSSSLPTSAHD